MNKLLSMLSNHNLIMVKYQYIKRNIGLLLLPVFLLLSGIQIQAQSSSLSVTINVGDVACNGGNNGIVAAEADGGSPPYDYIWSNGQTDPLLTGLTAGLYTVTVSDQVGATAVATATVNQPAALTLSLNSNYETCAGSNDAHASVEVMGGTFPFTYQWNDSQNQTTFIADNLSAGTYMVTVTDANGCSAVGSITIELSPEGVWIMLSSTPASCKGGADGTAHVSAMTGTAPYTYSWSNGNTTTDPTGLTAGPYTVTVTDANGCSAVDEVTVGEAPAIGVDHTVQDAQCNVSDGSVTITNVFGGTPGYTYNWSTGATTQSISGLSAGTYSFTVTDANGCTAVDEAIVGEPSTINVDYTVQNTQCNVSNGSVTITNVSGGTPTYTYNWSTGATTQSISGLSAGTYSFTVTDANGCTAVGEATVGEPPAIGVDYTVQDAQCNVSDGSITITNVSGGTPGYTYNWSTGATTQSISNLSAGTYGFTVTDADGCTYVQNGIEVKDDCTPCLPIIANVVVIEAHCGVSDGSITVNMVGGPANYTFSWDPPTASSSHIATNLAAGTYIVTATDISDINCSIIDTITVGTVDGPDATLTQKTAATCNAKDGTATFSPATYIYNWSSGETGNTATMLMAGSNQVTITDPVTNCFTVKEVIIETINPLVVTENIEKRPDCGQANGIVSIQVSGGSNSYTYLWNDGNIEQRRTDLSSGTWSVTVTDNGPTGCKRIHTFLLTDDVAGATITADSISYTSCPGAADATINFTYTLDPGFALPETVTIRDMNGVAQTNGSLAPGRYCIEIKDNNGCIAAGTCVDVRDATQIDVDVAVVNKTCFEGGKITLITIGGSAPYTYDWADISGTDNVQNRTGLEAGLYSFTVTDANGCTAFANDLMVDDECDPCDLVIDNVVVVEANCGRSDGSIIINMNGGPAGLTFAWNPNVSTNHLAMGLETGTYFVTISDGVDTSCKVLDTITVGTVGGPMATLVQKTPATCKESNGTATFSPQNYTYMWSNNETGNNATMLPAGNNQVTITDPVTQCSTVQEVFIETFNPLMVRDSVEKYPDCGMANGTVSILVSGGSFSYTYEWDDGSTGSRRTDLGSGIYTVKVTDNGPTGCTVSHTFVLKDDVAGATITLDSIVYTSCPGTNDGMSNFTYTLDPGFVGPETVVIRDMNGVIQTNGNLSPGTYCIEIRDANDCLAAGACFRVIYPAQLDVDIAIIEEECVDKGSITLVTTGGTGPYTYDWADIAGAVNMQNRTGLLAGPYSFTVTDANGCTAFANDLMVDDSCSCVPPIVQSVVVIETLCEKATGSATILVAGANNYSYDWTPSVSASFEAFNLEAGTYSVKITDLADTACYHIETFTVNNDDGPNSPYTMIPADCGVANGSVTFDSTNYVYNWSDGASGNPRTDLAVGSYSVTIMDIATPDCFGVITVKVDENNDFLAFHTVDKLPTCNAADGEVTISATGTGPYDFIWLSDNMNAAFRDDLPSGIHRVKVVDRGNNNCETIVEFLLLNNVSQANVNIFLSPVSTTCVDSKDGRINFDFSFTAGFQQPASFRIEDANGTNYVNGNLAPGDYCLIVRDSSGCVAGGECFKVIAPEQIDLDLAIRDADCGQPGSVVVTSLTGGNGGYTFDWSDLAGNNNIQDRPDIAAGNYGLTVTDTLGCSVSTPIIITGSDDLELTVTDDMVTCDPMADVSASSNLGGTVYVWTNAQGDTISQTGQLSIDATGTYYIAASSGACTDSDSVKVTFSTADVSIDGNNFICQGVDDATLTAVNNVMGDTLTYVWTPSSGITAAGNTATPTINTSDPGATIFIVEATNQFGCIDRDTFTTAIIDTTVNADLIVTNQCEALTIDFSVTGASLEYYQWNFGDPSNPNAVATGSPVTYVYPDTGTYTVLLTVPAGADCPIDTIRKDIYVAPTPLFDLDFGWEYEECGDTAVIAFSDSSTHQLSALNSWTWTFSNDTSSMDMNPVITVTESQQLGVQLIVTTASGCIDSISQTIDVNLVNVTLPDTVFACIGSDALLNPDTNSYGYVWLWSPATGLNDATAPNPTVAMPSSTQTYYVAVSDSAGICMIEDSVVVAVRSNLMDLKLSGDSISCSIDDVQLTASSTSAISYIWDTNNTFSNPFGTGETQMVAPGDRFNEKTYFVQATDAFGCMATDSITVTNYGIDLEFEAPEYLFCVGDTSPLLVTVGALADIVNDSIMFTWSPESIITDLTDPTEPWVSPTENTSMMVSAINRFGCVDTTNTELRIIEVDPIALSADPDSSCEKGSEVQLFATEIPNYTYTWMSSTGEAVDDVFNPIVRPEEDTEYMVVVREPEHGCTTSRTITITVTSLFCEEPYIFLPNAFTPNGDDRNDVLKVEGFNIRESYFVIYNRWGEKVFESKDKNIGWDGTFKGKNLSSDVYGYYLRVICVDGEEFTKQGNISLLR